MVVIFLFIGCPTSPPPPLPSPPPASLSELVAGGGPGVPYTIESFNLEGRAVGRAFTGFYATRIIATVTVTDGFITSVEIEGAQNDSPEWVEPLLRHAEPLMIAHNSIAAGLAAANEIVKVDIGSGATVTAEGIRRSAEDAMLQIAMAFEAPDAY